MGSEARAISMPVSSITETSNSFKPLQKEEEDELEEYQEWLEMQDTPDEDDLNELEAFREQIEEERAADLTFRAQAQEERAMIQAAQAHCSIAGGTIFRTISSEPKTLNSMKQSSSGFWGHSM